MRQRVRQHRDAEWNIVNQYLHRWIAKAQAKQFWWYVKRWEYNPQAPLIDFEYMTNKSTTLDELKASVLSANQEAEWKTS